MTKQKKTRALKRALTLSIVYAFIFVGTTASAPAETAKNSRSAVHAKQQASLKNMVRVDWQVTGSSCATCLIRLEKKLKATAGVLKVVVSIYKPFNAALIYDKKETSWTTIGQVFEGEKVGVANLKEATIDDLPLVLEPR